MPRKKTKKEALADLVELRGKTGAAAKAAKDPRFKMVHEAAYLGAAGLIMLDPLNRLADERIVLPLDMVCIPAYQAYMIEGSPALQIYVRAGETIIPTGGNVKDVAEALGTTVMEETVGAVEKVVKRKATAYQQKYKKAFDNVAKKYKLKNGKWKKNGFKAAVKAAHKIAGGKK